MKRISRNPIPGVALGLENEMQKITLSVFLFLFAPSAVATDFWGEAQVSSRNKMLTHQVNGRASGGSWFVFGQSVEGGYRQAYAGPKVSPTEWLEIGAAIGAETISEGWGFRFGSYVWAGKDRWSSLVSYENGRVTGSWYKGILKYQVVPSLALGIQTQKHRGDGVRAEYSINKAVSVWGTVLRKDETLTTQMAVRVTF